MFEAIKTLCEANVSKKQVTERVKRTSRWSPSPNFTRRAQRTPSIAESASQYT
jgi:hypothetical protein